MRRPAIFIAVVSTGCFRNLDFAPCQEDPSQSICFDTGTTETTTDSGVADSDSPDTGVIADSAVDSEAGSCTGASTQSCGKCGTQSRTCTDGIWSDWGMCTGEKECMPGDTAPGGTCANALEKSTKTCNASCTYDADVCALPKGWTKIADAPAGFVGRIASAAVWTGGELIVYGGGTSEISAGLKDAAMYRLRKNDWVTLPTPTVVAHGRRDTEAVWTGSSMLVWGGRDNSTFLSDGVEYRSDINSWQLLAASPLSARSPDHVLWVPTLQKMFVLSGYNASGCQPDSALYDWATSSWTKIATSPLSCRSGTTALWTGTEILVWGGKNSGGSSLADGALYNPSTNIWRTLPASPLAARAAAVATLTPSGVLIFGGTDFAPATPIQFTDYATVSTGATPAWAAKATVPAAVFPPRFQPQAWSSTTALFAWSGVGTSDFESTGAMFDESTSTWTALPTKGAPTGRMSAVSLSTGPCGLVWGGYSKPGGGVVELVTDGALYCP